MPYAWILLAIYLVGYAATWRKILWIVAHHDSFNFISEPEAMDWIFGGIFATIFSVIWPVTVLAYKLHEKGILQRNIAKPPKAHQLRAKADELEAKHRELLEREHRIDAMERRMEIGPYARK